MIWAPSEDHHVIHADPADLVMGADPCTYKDPTQKRYALFVNLTSECGYATHRHTVVMHYSMRDNEDPYSIPEQERMETFLWAAHQYACAGPTYWHCSAGLNRSGFFVAAYLHLYRGTPIQDAIALLRRERHPKVLCNPAFVRVLEERYG